MASKSAKATKTAHLAASLAVTPKDLEHVRAQLGRAESGLAGLTSARRREATARRLGLSVAELKALRSTLGGSGATTIGQSAIRQVAGLPHLSIAPRPVAARPSRSGAPPGRLSGTSKVYVTREGEVIHCFSDCQATRGFRMSSEPDPEVREAFLRDAVCRDRRACLVCCVGTANGYDGLLDQLHGKRGARLSGQRGRPGKAWGLAPTSAPGLRQSNTGRKRAAPPGPRTRGATDYWVWRKKT